MTRRLRRAVAAVLGLALSGSLLTAAPASAAATLTPVSNPLVALPAAGDAYLIDYPSTSVKGRPITLTGSLLLPKRKAPADGYPLAVWNHMTTGGADACAPSRARRGGTALTDMTSGDRVVEGLLQKGFAVVRPDYEGIGSPGPHPYLIGSSLARSVIDAAHAVAGSNGIGRDVVVAGHSEGAVATLFAGAADRAEWRDLRLRGVAALTPPTRMADLVTGVAQVPFTAGNATGEFGGLAALMIAGAWTVDPGFAKLSKAGGLSSRAQRLMPLVEKICYRDLSGPRAFGGLAPAELPGPRGEAAVAGLARVADRNDVTHLRLPRRLPIRLDAGLFDSVAPQPFVADLADTYRARGNRVVLASHPAGHSGLPRDRAAAAEVVTWLSRLVR